MSDSPFYKPVEPGPDQESVWDYPRPPRCEVTPETRIRVLVADQTIVDTRAACRVLETSHPPVYYIPVSELNSAQLIVSDNTSWCEWKGKASYFALRVGEIEIAGAGWFYPRPDPGFELLERCVGFYPSKMQACYVDDEIVTPQEGDFYGGWITSKVVGPFKGGPGTRGW